jgi:hypothetical protein
VGAAAHVRESPPDGTWILVEFRRGPVETTHPPGQIFSLPALICCPAPLSQEVGAALAQAAARMREVMKRPGSAHFRRAAGPNSTDLRNSSLADGARDFRCFLKTRCAQASFALPST